MPFLFAGVGVTWAGFFFPSMKFSPAFNFYPERSSVRIDARRLLLDTMTFTPSELGRVIKRCCKAWMEGDPSAFKSMPWVVSVDLKKVTKYRSRYIPESVRRDVLSVGACCICGSNESLSVDHIKPLAVGGTHARENLQCLCMKCNNRKAAKWEGEN